MKMRLIDADKLKKDLSENYVFYGFRQLLNDFYEALDSAPSINTKQVKYYDDDEKVWKIGEVIVNTLHDITDSYKGSEYNGNIKD